MRLLSIIVALALAAAFAWWFVLRHEGEPVVETGAAEAGAPLRHAAVDPEAQPAETEAAPVPVMALESRAASTTDRLVLRGRTEARRHVIVRAETSGRVVNAPLRAGARVAKGEVLCRLDPGAREAQLSEAEAAVAEARTQARAAQLLSQKGFTAETSRMASEAALQRAEAALNLVRLDLERLEIRAPFAGILESDTAELGALLSIADDCATVIDLSEVKVTGYVSEQDVDRLRVGQPVLAQLISGAEHVGTVDFVGRMADEATRTYRVEARLANEDGTLRDGMTAEIVIELPAEHAHLIPQSALTLDDEGRLGVRVVEGVEARFIPVRVLRDEATGVWVAGLPDVAKVIVIGQEFVRDGRTVAPAMITWDDLG